MVPNLFYELLRRRCNTKFLPGFAFSGSHSGRAIHVLAPLPCSVLMSWALRSSSDRLLIGRWTGTVPVVVLRPVFGSRLHILFLLYSCFISLALREPIPTTACAMPILPGTEPSPSQRETTGRRARSHLGRLNRVQRILQASRAMTRGLPCAITDHCRPITACGSTGSVLVLFLRSSHINWT
jgi:hypothetical protein